jgi:hypothetical protein
LIQITLYKDIDPKRVALLFTLDEQHSFVSKILKAALVQTANFFPTNSMPEIFLPILERSFTPYLQGKTDSFSSTTGTKILYYYH